MSQTLDISIDNFETAVMQASRERAVVLSFSSSRMPECAGYDTLLEKLSSELNFTLGKVNLDTPDNEAFIRSFQIRSLPDVRVLFHEEIADVLQGVMPEAALRERLAKFFISDEQREMQALENAVTEGRYQEAVPALETAIAAKPDDKKLPLLLARAEIGTGHTERAKAILAAYHEGDEGYDKAKSLLELMEFFVEASRKNIQGHEATVFHEACVSATREDYRSALQGFLSLVHENSSWNNSAASRAMLTLFSVLGPKHELTWEFRSRLNTALFI